MYCTYKANAQSGIIKTLQILCRQGLDDAPHSAVYFVQHVHCLELFDFAISPVSPCLQK